MLPTEPTALFFLWRKPWGWSLDALFVQDDVHHDAGNDEGNGAEEDDIVVVPSTKETEDEDDGADDHQDLAEFILEIFHNAIVLFLNMFILFCKLSNKKSSAQIFWPKNHIYTHIF